MLFWSLQVKSCGVIIQMELLSHTLLMLFAPLFFFILLQNDSSRGNRNLSLEPEVESINCTFA